MADANDRSMRRWRSGLAGVALAGAVLVPTACAEFDQFRDCATLVIDVGKFTVQALGDEQSQADAQTTLDGLKDKAPADVQTDLQYLGDQLNAIREAPDQAAREQIANSQEFQDAVKRLGEYVQRECEQG